ncbi:MAG: hypothetical protein FH749_07860 [Firmicutes bacterium]|nr:hypothetical protein [Bacillota bacterium]
MTLEQGKNSYVTVAQADEYVTGHYRSNSKDRQRWVALDEADKEVLLLNACAEMEQLPFQGRKAIRDQELAFPRLPFQYGQLLEPPKKVLAAQIELALWMSDDDTQAETSKRQELQDQGVTGFSLGDLSESYESTGARKSALLCPKTKALLSSYLSGGYATC